MRALAGNQFTAKLPLAQRRLLASYMNVRHVAAGEIIIREGEPGGELFIIAGGCDLSCHHPCG